MIIQGRDDRRRHHGDRNARLAEGAHGFQPPLRRGGARLHLAAQRAVQCCDRHAGPDQAFFGHGGEQVDVALDQGGFRQQADRVVVRRQHFQHLPGHLVGSFDRLVRVGVHAQRDRAADIAGAGEFPFQLPDRIGLVEKPTFEIETGGQPVEGMAGPGKAIDAAMLAAAIGVDRPVEGNVGRAVEGDHRPRRFRHHQRLDPRGILFDRVPAIIEGEAGLFLEPSGLVRDSPPSALCGAFGGGLCVDQADTAFGGEFLSGAHAGRRPRRTEQIKNKIGGRTSFPVDGPGAFSPSACRNFRRCATGVPAWAGRSRQRSRCRPQSRDWPSTVSP